MTISERATLEDFNSIPSKIEDVEPAIRSTNGAVSEEDVDPSLLEESPFPPGWSPDDAVAPDAGRLVGLTFAEACKAEIPPRSELVENLIDVGTVGLIAGLPFARKTYTAHEIAEKVALGAGLVFGRFPVLSGGPVIFAWQDDGTGKMLERIQAKASRHDYPDALPLRYLLNEGVRLPDDLPIIRELVERDRAVLLVFDSVYNFLAPTVPLKDEGVAAVLAETKREICDRTSCTVAFVDHAPWPTEGNRGQRRAYGSVFKTAAVRWSIHLEADAKDDSRLHVEASGNNVTGFRRTPATWDDDALEIRLLDIKTVDEQEVDEHVRVYINEHPGAPTKDIENGVTGSRDAIRKSLERLSEPGELQSVARGPGRRANGNYWYPANHAALQSPGDNQATLGDNSPGESQGQLSPESPSPRRGGDNDGDNLHSTFQEPE